MSEPAPKTREASFAFQGLELAYRETGPADGAGTLPVLALHGWMDNAGTFSTLTPLLGDRLVIAPDFSGHGWSAHRSMDADYYIWTYVEEVVALLAHLGIDRCHLLAHSMGGAVASVFTALYPLRVQSQVMLDMAGPITTPVDGLLEQMRIAVSAKEDIRQQSIRHYASFAEAAQSRANRGITVESAFALGQRGISSDDRGWYWSVDRQLTRRHLISLSEAQCEEIIKANNVPTLMVTAKETWDHRRDFLERRKSWFSQLSYHELDGNHFQHLEGRVGEVATLVNTFLEETASP